MKTPPSSSVPVPLPPLPAHLAHRPPLLTFKEVVDILGFWNLGGRRYAEDLRDCGDLPSVTRFTRGRQARYSLEMLVGLYPKGQGDERAE